jgi:hypothetical protein
MGQDRPAAAGTEGVALGRPPGRAQSPLFRGDFVGPTVRRTLEGPSRGVSIVLDLPAASAGMGGPRGLAESLANPAGGTG